MVHNFLVLHGSLRGNGKPACLFPLDQCILMHDIWKSQLVPEMLWRKHPKLSFGMNNLLSNFIDTYHYTLVFSAPHCSISSRHPHPIAGPLSSPNQFPFLISNIHFYDSYPLLPLCLNPFFPSQKNNSYFLILHTHTHSTLWEEACDL